jgi:hypothetical protein
LTAEKIQTDQQYFANQAQIAADLALKDALDLQMLNDAADNAQALKDIQDMEDAMTAAFAAEQAADILRVQQEERDYQAWLMEQVNA